MTDIVNAVLKMEYDAPDEFTKVSDTELTKIAYHEAGHVIVSELLNPGSVGLASIRTSGRDSVGGFVRRCKSLPTTEGHIMVSIAGKAAVEVNYGGCADGCEADIRRAYDYVRDDISENGSLGLGMVDVANHRFPDTSESMNSRNEAVVHAELERYMYKTKELIIKNKVYLDKVAESLLDRETLVASEIKRIKDELIEVEQ